jgi:hypothetical protein
MPEFAAKKPRFPQMPTGLFRTPAPVNLATFRGNFAADLLQMQQRRIIDSTSD